jgi:16S rRNA (adenine1518-N6/adenine1519-N6)-dimethyltransferase
MKYLPKKRLGQHFLEAAWADKLVAAIDPAPGDRFLEIGPGPGALTTRLAPRAQHVTAVELDPRMVADLRPRLPSNVTLVHADFLEFDVATLARSGPLRVAGNLPYNVSSPILFRLIEVARTMRAEEGRTGGLLDATVMVQLEVAERIEAPPGTRDYGVLSILVQLHADVRRLLTLPPGAFRPVPAVHSAVIGLTFRAPQVPVPDLPLFEAMVRSMFTQRRKTLGNALRRFAEVRDLGAADVLREAGIDARRRPETLQLAELARLAELFAAAPRTPVL